MIEMVTASFDLSKACDIGSIPVELLKNYEPELSYILAELFDMCLRESCLPDCLKDSSVCMLGTVQQLKPCLFSIIENFKWFWMGILCKNKA